MKSKLSIVIVVMLVITSFVGFICYDNSRIVNSSYVYSSPKVSEAFDGYKITVVTDYHNSDKIDKTIAAIKAQEPDIICIAGDLVDMDTTDFTNAIEFVNQASEIAPVYYSYGNHEIWSNNYNNTVEPIIRKKLKDCNINIINNKTVKLEKDGEYFYLTGFEDMKYDDLSNAYEIVLDDKLDKLQRNVAGKKAALSVLMFHRANYFDIVSDYPYDIVLSGHIHGGQVRIPGIMNAIINSHMGGSKYVKGEYNKNDKTLLVCGGIGLNNGVPRIFNTPEIMTVELAHLESEESDKVEATPFVADKS